jgi:two-component system LytT family response regulator
MCADRRLRVLVVDDEALGRLRVEDLLRREKDVDVVGTASDGPSAIAAIRPLAPELVFLDVQMPGCSGVEVVRQIGADAMPATIFVTAYDQYAIQAFDVAAVDYLVKPFDDERFEQAFRRARRHLTLAGLDRLRGQLLAVLQEAPAPPTVEPPSAGRQDHILVDLRGTIEAVPVVAIDYIVASGPYARLQVGDRRHVVRESMRALETRLDPTRFLRIHRSVIVRLDLVEALERTPSNEVLVRLRSGVRLRVSRSRRAALERWLAGDRLRV